MGWSLEIKEVVSNMGMSLVSLRPRRRWEGRGEDAAVGPDGGVLSVKEAVGRYAELVAVPVPWLKAL